MTIGIIIGSVREQRVGASIAHWIHRESIDRDHGYALIDLREYDLPQHSELGVPALIDRDYADPRVRAWGQAVDACEGFIFVTPEYNHGVPGTFKNAFDSIFPEWWSKTVAFVGYGAALGFRVVEQWRPIVANANMYDVKAQLAVSTITHYRGDEFVPGERHPVELAALFDSLEAATRAMSAMRSELATR